MLASTSPTVRLCTCPLGMHYSSSKLLLLQDRAPLPRLKLWVLALLLKYLYRAQSTHLQMKHRTLKEDTG